MRLAAIAVLIALTVAVRAPDAISEALWWDEVRSARAITTPSSITALARIRGESSPPAWFFLGRLTYGSGLGLTKAGAPGGLASMEAVRVLSVLASAILTVLAFLYAQRLLRLPGAFLAGLLVALAYQSVLHGKELRPYALVALLAMALPFALEAALENPSRRRLIGLGLIVGLGALTHYFFLVALATACGWLWTTRPAAWRAASAAIAIGLVPLLAWLPALVYQVTRVNEYFPAFSARRVFNLYPELFATGGVWQSAGAVGRAGVTVAVLAGSAVLARRSEGRLCAALAVTPVAVTALLWLLGLRIFDVRNLIIVLPFAAVSLAALTTAPPPRFVAASAVLGVSAAMVWAFSVNQALGRTPHHDVARTLSAWGWTEGEAVVHFGSFGESASLGWHLPGHPRLVLGRPGETACSRLYAVVDSRVGHRWLQEQGSAVTARMDFPSYTGWTAGRRKARDLVAARIPSSAVLLADADRLGAFLYYARDVPLPRCLEPVVSSVLTAGRRRA